MRTVSRQQRQINHFADAEIVNETQFPSKERMCATQHSGVEPVCGVEPPVDKLSELVQDSGTYIFAVARLLRELSKKCVLGLVGLDHELDMKRESKPQPLSSPEPPVPPRSKPVGVSCYQARKSEGTHWLPLKLHLHGVL